MRPFTTEEIQARFEQLPAEIQAAATSTEVQDKIRAISDKHSLHVDQFGELVEEIGLVMLGLRRSNMFVPDLVSRLGIAQKEAEAISTDVSTDIFSAIRKHLQEIDAKAEEEELADTTVPHMEQAGDMEILSDAPHTEMHPEKAVPSTFSAKPYVEPLVDRLLASPAARPAQKTERTVPTTSATAQPQSIVKPAAQPAAPRIDPYRETF